MRLRKNDLEKGAPELEYLGVFIPKDLKAWFKTYAAGERRTMTQQLEWMLVKMKYERESKGCSE